MSRVVHTCDKKEAAHLCFGMLGIGTRIEGLHVLVEEQDGFGTSWCGHEA